MARTPQHLVRRVAMTASLLLASGVVLVLNQQTVVGAGPASPVDACVEKFSQPAGLSPGQVRKTDPNRQVVAVGGRGLTVTSTVSSTGSDGSAEAADAVEAVVTTGDDSDQEAMAKDYAARGRSVLKDAQAAGVGEGLLRDLCEDALAKGDVALSAAGDGTIFDSVCVHDDTDAVEWDGCATRYRVEDNDASWNYGIDDSQAHGHETACCYWNDLHKGGVKNRYESSYVDIIKGSPGSDITDVSSCYSQSFGLTVAGFGASTGGTICPDRWDITWPGQSSGTESIKTEWQGETNSDRQAVSLAGYRVKPGHSTSYSIVINWDVH